MASTADAADSASVSAFVDSLPVTVNDIHISGNERTYSDFIERELQPIREATNAGQLAKKAYEAVAVSPQHRTTSPAALRGWSLALSAHTGLSALLYDRLYRAWSRTAYSRK